MHADEVHIDAALVGRLLAAQFPQWADLPLRPIDSTGTDNAIFRLGEDMVVRLPRIHWAIAQVDREQRWLPRFAPLLPLAIPVPLAKGHAAEGYPWDWAVYRWLEGENASVEPIGDLARAATDLARFVAALQRIDPTGGPIPGPLNSGRGVPLATRDADTRAAIASLDGMLDADAVTEAWEAALHAPVWGGPPVWIHGDIAAGNLLVEQGRVTAVIDFGCLGVGDPACDLMIAWTLLSADPREAFREALSVDDATWARGRGWALSCALIYIPYYLNTNPLGVANARHAIDEVLAERAR